MDPEIKKTLDALRAELGKNVDGLARLAEIEKAASARDADVKALRTEIEAVRKSVTEREETIRDLQQKQKTLSVSGDPAKTKREGVGILGMQVRQMIARAINQEIPEMFRGEADQVKRYMAERVAFAQGATPGSYLIPTALDTMIYDAIEELSEVLGLVDFKTGLPPGNLTMNFFTSRPALKPKRATKDTAMTESTTGMTTLSVLPDDAYIFFGIDNAMFQMSPVDLGNYALQMLRTGVLEGIANWIVAADGTATYNSVTGLLNEATYVTSLTAGHKTIDAMDHADMVAVMKSILKRGRRGVWFGGLGTLGRIQSIDRLGKAPIITYDAAGNELVFGRKYIVDEGMPEPADVAADKAFLCFGDLSAMLVAIAGGIQYATSTEYKFGYNQTCFRATMSMDIKRKPANVLRTVKTAAA